MKEKIIDLKYLKQFLSKDSGTYLQVWSSETLKTPFEIKPEKFLQYAEKDISENSQHSRINAMSNIKRALSSQIDSLLIEFGLFDKSQKERWNIPTKLEILKKIGIVSPRVLENINHKRNLLEHKYKKVNNEEVEDALGTVSLFLVYTQKFTECPLGECELYNPKLKEELELELDYKNKKIIFFNYELIHKKSKRKILKKITADSSEYLDYLKEYVNVYSFKS